MNEGAQPILFFGSIKKTTKYSVTANDRKEEMTETNLEYRLEWISEYIWDGVPLASIYAEVNLQQASHGLSGS